MKPLLKKSLVAFGSIASCLAVAGFGYAQIQGNAFDRSMDKVYAIPVQEVVRTAEPAVLARGKHLAESLGGCAARDCHGSDYGGGRELPMGPLGTIWGPNITSGGMLAVYSDGELSRLIRRGIKKDGRSVRMMPVQDFYWLPDDDIRAIISYLRSVPKSDKPSGATKVGMVGKVLDRQGKFVWDVARHVEGLPKDEPPAPEPTAAYGRFVVRLCTGCHGETLSGGPLPGAPPSIPTPSNITIHETGIKDYGFEDFVRLLRTGTRKSGAKLNPFMAIELTKNLDEIELRALWMELQSRPPKPFGGR